MAVINNDYQTNLLFKRFTGVAATQLNSEFSNEPFRAIKNIFSRDILIEEVPDQAPISIYTLDNSNNWLDSDASGNPSMDSSGNTFPDLYPDSHLQFYKNVELKAVPGSQNRVWRKLDSLGKNLLQDTINFKFDDVNSSYLMRVKHQPNSVYINNTINSFPLFWVFDSESGFLQMHQTQTLLESVSKVHINPPKISYFRYVGKKRSFEFRYIRASAGCRYKWSTRRLKRRKSKDGQYKSYDSPRWLCGYKWWRPL